MPALSTDVLCDKLLARFKSAKNDKELFQEIANGPFTDKLRATSLDLGIAVLLQVNKKLGSIDRVALSNTEMAKNTLKISDKPFHDIRIPLDDPNNLIAKAIRTRKPQHTTDWEFLFTPALSGTSARFNQAAGGVDCSYIYPLRSRNGGALIFSFFTPQQNISTEHHEFMDCYSKAVDAAL